MRTDIVDYISKDNAGKKNSRNTSIETITTVPVIQNLLIHNTSVQLEQKCESKHKAVSLQ